MTTFTFTNHVAKKALLGIASDAGHAWLMVDIDPVDGFENALNWASQYSYIDAEQRVVYLEEDCDAPAFLKHHGLDFALGLPEYYLEDGSVIRNLPRGTNAQ